MCAGVMSASRPHGVICLQSKEQIAQKKANKEVRTEVLEQLKAWAKTTLVKVTN